MPNNLFSWRFSASLTVLILCCASPAFSVNHPDWCRQDREWIQGFFGWGHRFHEVDAVPVDDQGHVIRVGVRFFAISILFVPVWHSDSSFVTLVEGMNPITGEPAAGYMTIRDYMLGPVVNQYGKPGDRVPGFYRWTPWVLVLAFFLLCVVSYIYEKWISARTKAAGTVPAALAGDAGPTAPT